MDYERATKHRKAAHPSYLGARHPDNKQHCWVIFVILCLFVVVWHLHISFTHLNFNIKFTLQIKRSCVIHVWTSHLNTKLILNTTVDFTIYYRIHSKKARDTGSIFLKQLLDKWPGDPCFHLNSLTFKQEVFRKTLQTVARVQWSPDPSCPLYVRSVIHPCLTVGSLIINFHSRCLDLSGPPWRLSTPTSAV